MIKGKRDAMPPPRKKKELIIRFTSEWTQFVTEEEWMPILNSTAAEFFNGAIIAARSACPPDLAEWLFAPPDSMERRIAPPGFAAMELVRVAFMCREGIATFEVRYDRDDDHLIVRLQYEGGRRVEMQIPGSRVPQ